jgi:hypothetical protein
MYGKRRNAYEFRCGHEGRKTHCEGSDSDRRIILKWILRVIAWDGWTRLGSE